MIVFFLSWPPSSALAITSQGHPLKSCNTWKKSRRQCGTTALKKSLIMLKSLCLEYAKNKKTNKPSGNQSSSFQEYDLAPGLLSPRQVFTQKSTLVHNWTLSINGTSRASYFIHWFPLSSCRAASTDLCDSLSPPVSIIHRSLQVLQSTSWIGTEQW